MISNFRIGSLACLVFVVMSSIHCKTKQKVVQKEFLDQQFEISIRQFGAIPNDGLDDSRAIQAAVDHAITSGISSLIRLEPGIYDIEHGIVIGHQMTDGEYSFVSFQLSGSIPGFTPEQRFGATTVFRSKTNGFTIAVQLGRNCLVENIVFEGTGLQHNSASEIMNSVNSDWDATGQSRTNRYSPHCAIAIDPFHRAVPSADQYPGAGSYYSNSSNGGTSMLTIRGCTFFKYFIGIANNPSNGVQNGDNIRAEDCHVSNCHTFWACGQTQSRCNSINNIYALFLNTFVSGVEIGQRQGTPPTVSNVNISGFCKYVFNVHTLFSGIWMEQSYMESLWSLGIALANTVSFDQCQIVFKLPEGTIFAPPFHLYNATTANFRDCGIEYFNNCNTPAPIMMRTGALQISGGWIEGGIIASNGITNEGGDDIHNVTFQNVLLKCQGSIVGKVAYNRPIEKTANEILLGNESFKTNDQSVFTNTGNTYNIYPLGDIDLIIDHQSKTGSFTFTSANLIKPGDNIFSSQTITRDELALTGRNIRPALGFVSHVSGNNVFLENIPEGIVAGHMDAFMVEYPVFIPPLWGKIKMNSATITDIISYSDSFFPKKGTRIFAEGILPGTYVIESDPLQKRIVVSRPAMASGNEILIRNADYSQDIFVDHWNPQQIPVLIEGATINLKKTFNSSLRLINTTKAILNTPFKSTLKPVE